MKLTDLTIAFMGDSLTEGIGASSPEKSYPSVFQEITDIKKALNYGLSGTRIARQTKTFMHYSQWDRDFISRVDEISESADCVVICGCANDYMHGDAELGKFDDRGEYTFYGAMHILINALKERFPNKPLIFMTPSNILADKSPERAHINKGYHFDEYLSAVKEVCAYYDVPVFDLHSVWGLDPENEEDRKLYYSDDSHLNDKGYRRMAEMLAEFMIKE